MRSLPLHFPLHQCIHNTSGSWIQGSRVNWRLEWSGDKKQIWVVIYPSLYIHTKYKRYVREQECLCGRSDGGRRGLHPHIRKIISQSKEICESISWVPSPAIYLTLAYHEEFCRAQPISSCNSIYYTHQGRFNYSYGDYEIKPPRHN